jgi:predicted RNA binding protein YcfA (HicA-like mRNA interferase family)
MKSISGKDFAKVLEQNGWTLLRIQGSHHIYGKPGISDRISVPIHGNKSLKTGLLRLASPIAPVLVLKSNRVQDDSINRLPNYGTSTTISVSSGK